MINQKIEMEKLNWDKGDGLIPAIIQDCTTLQVLMLGYMNSEALEETLKTGNVTFYSRTRKRLWVKGETSGNYLSLVNIIPDCDNDALVVSVKPKGLSCHLNNTSCFNGSESSLDILSNLEFIINQRCEHRPPNSYVAKLFAEGRRRIAQKVGEEAVEVVLASVSGTETDVINEAADLLFHLLVLLRECHINLMDVTLALKARRLG